jgi:hypothetical protein
MLQHASKAAQQIGFGGNFISQAVEQAKPLVADPRLWATVGTIALSAGQTALTVAAAVGTAAVGVATSPVTLTVAGVAGTAYLVHELSKEDDD